MADASRASRSALLLVLPALLGLLLTGCAGPTIRDEAIYGQAEKSASAMISEVETTLLVTRTQLRDDSWWRYADTVVTDAETAATTIQSTFTSRQPPSSKSQPLYEDTSKALADAADLVTQMRVALRHHDVAAMQSLRSPLAKASSDLEKLETRARTQAP